MKHLDRVWINESVKTTNTYNPGGVADSAAYGASSSRNVEGKFSVKKDLLSIVEGLRTRNVPTFEDGNYRALVSPRFNSWSLA